MEAFIKRTPDEETEKPIIQNAITKETDEIASTQSVTNEVTDTEEITGLKNSARTLAGWVTRTAKQMDDLLHSQDNLQEVKTALSRYNELMQKYTDAHESLLHHTSDEKKQKEILHFEVIDKRNREFQTKVALWIRNAEDKLSDQLESSTVRSRSHRSSSSKRSSTSSSSSRSKYVQAKARIAELQVEKTFQAKQQDVAAKQQELAAKQQELAGKEKQDQIDLDIAKATARMKCYEEDMNEMQREEIGYYPSPRKTKKCHFEPLHEIGSSESQHCMPTKGTNSERLPLTEYSVLNPHAFSYTPSNQIAREPLPVENRNKATTDLMYESHRQLAASLVLPHIQVQMFSGDPLKFIPFMMAFKSRIIPHVTSNSDKLFYLHQHLEGQPKQLISGCLFMTPDRGYQKAMDILQQEYGNSFKIATSYTDKLKNWHPVRADDGKGLRDLALFMVECNEAMQSVAEMQVMNHLPNLQMIATKLPTYLQTRWLEHCTSDSDERHVDFDSLTKLVDHAARSANHPVFSYGALLKSTQSAPPACHSKTSFATTVDKSASDQICASDVEMPHQCYICSEHHHLDDCTLFMQKTIDERRKFVIDFELCFGCFGRGHTSKGCKQRRKCKKCLKLHPTSMHIDNFKASTEKPEQQNTVPAAHNTVSAACTTQSTVLQAILPVKLQCKTTGRTVDTYAFYDNGSTACFLKESVKELLQPEFIETTMKLKTMHGVDVIPTAIVNNLVVYDAQGHNGIDLPQTFTRFDIPVNPEQIPRREILQNWHHLADILHKIPEYNPSMEIGLLIGSNCPQALQPLQVIPTSGNQPFAARYKHGWTVNGPTQVNVNQMNATCNRIVVTGVEQAVDCITTENVSKLFNLDFSENDLGAFPDERAPSYDDRKFLEIAKKTIRVTDGKYEIAMPFKDQCTIMPNNRKQASMRLQWQRKKMITEKDYHANYTAFMQKLIAKGYAYKAIASQKHASWYLPHHGVYHPQKGKIRVVFDCSAKCNGVSLNDMLLQGPDLTNSLIGTLLRFREEPIAFTGDIEAMFYQIKVPPTQHDFLGFLWWPDGDLSLPVEEYKMSVHTFGAISSPSIANYALKTCADKADDKYDKRVGETIRRNFYVDDCLKSCNDAGSAIKLVKDLRNAVMDGGFHLTKFISNSKEVMKTIPDNELANDCEQYSLDPNNATTRALGMLWKLKDDTFGFSSTLKEKPTTRRGMLSMICSLYDPFGFLSPFTLLAKRILQELCKVTSLGWDSEVPSEYVIRWNKWLSDLPMLEKFTIPRCLKPKGFQTIEFMSLHIFSDASSSAYGVAAYLVMNNRKAFHSCLVTAKSRVAPLKTISIPRLELAAAAVSVKVGHQILRELDMKVSKVVYHTDSTAVLHFIHSESKRFPVYVANRVKMIRDFSDPGQWRYVHTSENPADIASRGLSAGKLCNNTLWLSGPKFLCTNEQPSSLEACPECKQEQETSCAVTAVEAPTEPSMMLIEHYSSWYKLQRAVVVYQRLSCLLKNKRKAYNTAPISVDELRNAQNAIIRYTQQRYFPTETQDLSRTSGNVSKRSSTYKLDPFLGDHNLLRVGGRIRRANIQSTAKHPILLPSKCHVTSLLIRYTHENLAHAGRNHVLSKLREQFWIISANASVRYALFRCVTCRKLREPVVEQKMSDLPKERLEPSAPFSGVGLDYFGPLTVKDARKELKRYGVIFTCLASRAVHIETANSLDTNSFINALRRFISRRGTPQIIRCDNGTNFRGAEKELEKAVQEMDKETINTYLLKHKIEWKFNPPAASHMGGIWERQVRTVKKVLSGLLVEHGERLNDEALRTLLCEVEVIVNSRPLTSISDSVDDLEPLTPNHLLMPRSPYILPPPGDFQHHDTYLRRRWRHVQYLVNLFWTRWRREYLVTLQTRPKWNRQKRSLHIGDIVLIKSEIEPRNVWPMARVLETHPDSSGNVRSVLLKTKASQLVRPVQKLVLLLPVKN